MPQPARQRVANPRQGDFAKPDSEKSECPAVRLADERASAPPTNGAAPLPTAWMKWSSPA